MGGDGVVRHGLFLDGDRICTMRGVLVIVVVVLVVVEEVLRPLLVCCHVHLRTIDRAGLLRRVGRKVPPVARIRVRSRLRRVVPPAKRLLRQRRLVHIGPAVDDNPGAVTAAAAAGAESRVWPTRGVLVTHLELAQKRTTTAAAIADDAEACDGEDDAERTDCDANLAT